MPSRRVGWPPAGAQRQKPWQGPIGPPDPASHHVDHYKCYTIMVSKGIPRFQLILDVPVVDQFNQPKPYDLKKPTPALQGRATYALGGLIKACLPSCHAIMRTSARSAAPQP
jgi:hypothetical protein